MARKSLDIYINDIVKRYEGGESENSISKTLGVARTKIRRLLLIGGATIRKPLQANRLMMQQRTPEEHKRNTRAANKAARGRKATLLERCKRANTVQQIGNTQSKHEQALYNLLVERGFMPIVQHAIGPYNCDLTIHPVAVEIFGGGWHWYGRHMARLPKRLIYLMDRGWSVLMITADKRRDPISCTTADYIISYLECLCSSPPPAPEYRVIKSSGELIAQGSCNDDNITIKETLTCRLNARRHN